jgi:hypothetical protein
MFADSSPQLTLASALRSSRTILHRYELSHNASSRIAAWFRSHVRPNASSHSRSKPFRLSVKLHLWKESQGGWMNHSAKRLIAAYTLQYKTPAIALSSMLQKCRTTQYKGMMKPHNKWKRIPLNFGYLKKCLLPTFQKRLYEGPFTCAIFSVTLGAILSFWLMWTSKAVTNVQGKKACTQAFVFNLLVHIHQREKIAAKYGKCQRALYGQHLKAKWCNTAKNQKVNYE